jgi:hypothetical protein
VNDICTICGGKLLPDEIDIPTIARTGITCDICFENSLELDDYAYSAYSNQDGKCYICKQPIKTYGAWILVNKVIVKGSCCNHITFKTPFCWPLGAFKPIVGGE